MQNLSDEDIDKLFKRAAEKQQTQFDPADWDNMASRLDANKKPWLNYYTGVGSIVLLGVVIWLGWFINKPNVTELAASVSASAPKETTSRMDKTVETFNTSSSTANTLSSSTGKTENVGASQSVSLEMNSVALTNQKVGDNVRYGDGSKDESKLTRKKSSAIASSELRSISRHALFPVSIGHSNQTVSVDESQRSIKTGTEINHGGSDVENKNNTLVDSNFDLNESHLNTTVAMAETAVVILDEESTLNKQEIDGDVNLTSDQKSNQHESLKKDKTSITNATDSVKENINEREDVSENKNVMKDLVDSTLKQTRFSRFAARATIAPDFSSEQFNSVEKMGFNYGLVVEYFLSKNFSIATGALWSRKYYSAVDVDYNGYHADRAYGDCRMWDIPVNVNYYFTPSKQYSFFASAGLSSYLMNEENYDYEVDSGYSTKTYSSQIKKENNEWFKILNISVGLQKQIGSRFSIQVEPFVKVPLAGVGEGNISLSSFGSFFSVRYNF